MGDIDNSKNDNEGIGSGLLGLLIVGVLGYAAYKSTTSNSEADNMEGRKQTISSYEIEDIVNQIFRDLQQDEVQEFALYYFMPGILGFKEDLYNRMMLYRLTRINETIKSMLAHDFEGYNPILGETQFNELISFIKNDCYNEIKATKFFAQLKGNVLKHIPGMKLIGGDNECKCRI